MTEQIPEWFNNEFRKVFNKYDASWFNKEGVIEDLWNTLSKPENAAKIECVAQAIEKLKDIYVDGSYEDIASELAKEALKPFKKEGSDESI